MKEKSGLNKRATRRVPRPPANKGRREATALKKVVAIAALRRWLTIGHESRPTSAARSSIWRRSSQTFAAGAGGALHRP
jgi:hypothetical protein